MPAKASLATIKDALTKSGGNMAAAARLVGVDRSTILRRVQQSAELREAQQDAAEAACDLAEYTVMRAMQNNELTAAFYWLNNSPAAKRRGWGPRQEVTGADGGPLRIEFVNDWRTNSD